MQFVTHRRSGHVFGIIGFVSLSALLSGCKKDNGPAPEPAKEVAAETKPAVNENPAPKAAVTPAPGTTETALPQAAPSASAAGTLNLSSKSPNGAGTPAEVAAAPANSAQNPPIPAETAVPAPIATPTTPEAPPPPVESPKQNGQAFSVWLQSSGKYTAGQQGAVEAVVMPKGEFHCNQEYPYKFVTSSLSTGVTFPKSTYRAEGLSLSPNRAVMRIPFVPQSAGEARIGGTFHFSVCTDQQCVVEKRDVFVTVNVQ
jgi:hypothetical protein